MKKFEEPAIFLEVFSAEEVMNTSDGFTVPGEDIL